MADEPSALMRAMMAGNKEEALQIIARGEDVNAVCKNATTGEVECALSCACIRGGEWLDVIEKLVEKCDLARIDSSVEPHRGAIHWACSSRSLPVIKAVCGLAGINVNLVDRGGRTGLKSVLSLPEDELVEILKVVFAAGFKLEGATLSLVADMGSEFEVPYRALRWLFTEGGLKADAEIPLAPGEDALLSRREKRQNRVYHALLRLRHVEDPSDPKAAALLDEFCAKEYAAWKDEDARTQRSRLGT